MATGTAPSAFETLALKPVERIFSPPRHGSQLGGGVHPQPGEHRFDLLLGLEVVVGSHPVAEALGGDVEGPTFEIARYLCSSKIPIDVKAAIINALSWDVNGKKNAELFSYYLGLKYRKSVLDLSMEQLTADELFCLGYLSVMDDYFRPENAIPILKMVREQKPKSFTVAIILALTQAQNFMNKDLKKVWQVVNEVIENKKLEQDLCPEAKKIILDYMVLYK